MVARDSAVEPFVDVELDLPDRRAGKVRISYALENRQRLFVTTDRLSAFDRVLAGVPWKGQVLNELSAWWFVTTRDIVDNHLVSVPDPNATVAIAATPLPVEVVVRGHITGVTSTSLWQRYAAGEREIYGHRLPDGLRQHQALPAPLITPTTKAEAGTGHDEPISSADVVARGLVDAERWDEVQAAALALFERGERLASEAGLILADTKYELGVDEAGTLVVADEIHTPDSSRYWYADSYEQVMREGGDPRALDKEYVRRWLVSERGYRGEGEPPRLPDEVRCEAAARYIEAFERVTGQAFVADREPPETRIRRNLGLS
jgi:phosphoribosylaminoimidazole-succinocarboxamide synthase